MVGQTEFLKRYNEQLTYSVDDLRNCENEPLATCGAIQSFGYFVGFDPLSLRVTAVSENLGPILGFENETLLGSPLATFLTLEEGVVVDSDSIRRLREQRFPQLVLLAKDGQRMKCQAHFSQSTKSHYIELEPEGDTDDLKTHDHLHRLISRLEASTSFENDCVMVCETFREMCGFDRVLTYRFRDNWDGEVIAEARSESFEPFLGLMYPATDIPPQARDLYLKCPYRLILDSMAIPVPILTPNSSDRISIELDDSYLRAASPIHIEYLQNMGVRSAFSVGIKVHNKLWGLISCHHYQHPLPLQPEARSAMELIGRILSGRVSNYIERRRLLAKKNSFEFSQTFMENLTNGMPTKESFKAAKGQLLTMLQASGAFVRIQGDEICLGSCPPLAIVEGILEKARQTSTLGIWKSHELKKDLGLDATPAQAAGALAIPFSFGFEDFIIWFRPEAEQTVSWGGRPQKSTNDLGRLNPRKSFSAWIEDVKDSSHAWSEENEESAQFLLFHFIKGIFSKAAALSLANKELERVTRAKDEFIGMVSHELRTPLSAIIGWVDILKDSIQGDNEEAFEAIEVIDRNAKLQVNLINDLLDISRIISGKLRLAIKPSIDVASLVRDIVESLEPTAQAKRIHLFSNAEDPIIASLDADRIRQVVWNLITNAIKFTPHGGMIHIKAERRESNYRISVKDSGIGLAEDHLKSIFDRFSQVEGAGTHKGGLGLGLSIAKSLVELHGGEISAMSEGIGRGSTFVLEIPIFAASIDTPKKELAPIKPSDVPLILSGKKVLLVEDQRDTAAAVKHLIEKMGGHCSVHYDALNALKVLAGESFDLIISDVGLPELNGYDFMRALRQLEKAENRPLTPAIALTAYATAKDRVAALASGFQSHIPKPVDKTELAAVIESLQVVKVFS